MPKQTTIADCRAGVCPCAGSVNPGADFECPPDRRSYEEIELERDRQLNRPFEEDEGIPIHWS